MRDQLFARTDARYRRWDADCARNAEIRRRVAQGQPIGQVANAFGVSPHFVERIAGAWNR